MSHVLTSDLGIIKDRALRKRISKGPFFREQNNIHWKINYEICSEAVKEYKCKWVNKGVDRNFLMNESLVISLLNQEKIVTFDVFTLHCCMEMEQIQSHSFPFEKLKRK